MRNGLQHSNSVNLLTRNLHRYFNMCHCGLQKRILPNVLQVLLKTYEMLVNSFTVLQAFKK